MSQLLFKYVIYKLSFYKWIYINATQIDQDLHFRQFTFMALFSIDSNVSYFELSLYFCIIHLLLSVCNNDNQNKCKHFLQFIKFQIPSHTVRPWQNFSFIDCMKFLHVRFLNHVIWIFSKWWTCSVGGDVTKCPTARWLEYSLLNTTREHEWKKVVYEVILLIFNSFWKHKAD